MFSELKKLPQKLGLPALLVTTAISFASPSITETSKSKSQEGSQLVTPAEIHDSENQYSIGTPVSDEKAAEITGAPQLKPGEARNDGIEVDPKRVYDKAKMYNVDLSIIQKEIESRIGPITGFKVNTFSDGINPPKQTLEIEQVINNTRADKIQELIDFRIQRLQTIKIFTEDGAMTIENNPTLILIKDNNDNNIIGFQIKANLKRFPINTDGLNSDWPPYYIYGVPMDESIIDPKNIFTK